MESFRDNLIKKIGEENFNKIQSIRIGVAGAGGLGSNCAVNLVRVGFRKFTIVDFDVIMPSNLDRQFFFSDQVGMKKAEALKINLCRINPNLEIRIISCRIEKDNIKSLFNDCDVVVECLDSAEDKSMLVGEASRTNKFIVSVSGLGGVDSSDDITIHNINDNLVLIGDLRSDIKEKPALSPRVNVAAAKQADVVLSYALKNNFSKNT